MVASMDCSRAHVIRKLLSCTFAWMSWSNRIAMAPLSGARNLLVCSFVVMLICSFCLFRFTNMP